MVTQVDEFDCVSMFPLSCSLSPYILKIQPTRELGMEKGEPTVLWSSWIGGVASQCPAAPWSNRV